MAELAQTFEDWVDAQNFEEHGYTIVRLEGSSPLDLDFLNRLQVGKANSTKQYGKFSWTKFPNWQKALEYYRATHRTVHEGNLITATPISEPNFAFEHLMDRYRDESFKYDVVRGGCNSREPVENN